MNQLHRRGVTRGYVAGLVFAVVVIAFTLLLVVWAAISLYGDREVVSTPGVGAAVAPAIVLVLLGLLAWSLWAQAIVLLRGRQQIAIERVLIAAVGAYLIWCLVGTLFGFSTHDSWMSPYALTIAVVWAVCSVLCWAVLVRRVYTDRPTPKWPWEHKDDLGPDWAHTDENPWDDPNDGNNDESAEGDK